MPIFTYIYEFNNCLISSLWFLCSYGVCLVVDVSVVLNFRLVNIYYWNGDG
ncbi:hypothetical protein [Vibrio gallaecicus]|uniref:hypothetical protein n=1 Tax=Vibrio gallaecicus TaxID=552386 RepID=UPI0025B5A39D|nr:hypothetical protein [Vibrio gallaecicus]MDN3615674.1 hypothetical protein [Vibrio gallaecicus]